MKSRIKRNNRSLMKRRIQGLRKALPAIAREAQKAAYVQAQLALNTGVYGTTPGRYQRTGNLRQELTATAQANATSVGLVVQDTADYASAIEYGTGPHALSEAQLTAYLEAMPEGGLLNFGRSGEAYMLPHPYVSVGLYKGRAVARQMFERTVQELWR